MQLIHCYHKYFFIRVDKLIITQFLGRYDCSDDSYAITPAYLISIKEEIGLQIKQ